MVECKLIRKTLIKGTKGVTLTFMRQCVIRRSGDGARRVVGEEAVSGECARLGDGDIRVKIEA
ncbi:unnamed protein product [Prunus armeniaca]